MAEAGPARKRQRQRAPSAAPFAVVPVTVAPFLGSGEEGFADGPVGARLQGPSCVLPLPEGGYLVGDMTSIRRVAR